MTGKGRPSPERFPLPVDLTSVLTDRCRPPGPLRGCLKGCGRFGPEVRLGGSGSSSSVSGTDRRPRPVSRVEGEPWVGSRVEGQLWVGSRVEGEPWVGPVAVLSFTVFPPGVERVGSTGGVVGLWGPSSPSPLLSGALDTTVRGRGGTTVSTPPGGRGTRVASAVSGRVRGS